MNDLVKKAIGGDKKALEKVILSIKDLVYNLSLKMLLFPEEAQDASQDILVKIITHLSTFKGKSQFSTWVYRLASNHLIDYKRKSKTFQPMSFSEYENFIDSGHSLTVAYTQNAGELSLLEEEVKVSCTHGLLLCLDSPHRLVYILGEILEFNSVKGSQILEITSENYRRKLSRSRKKIRDFLSNKCGLYNEKNPCKCSKKIDFLINNHSIDPEDLRFATHSKRSIDLVKQIEQVRKTRDLYQSVPDFKTPKELVNKLKHSIKILEYE